MTLFRALVLGYGAVCVAAGAVLAWLVFMGCTEARRVLAATQR